MNIHDSAFRQKIWFILNTIQANQLFVHSQSISVQYEDPTTGDQNAQESKTKGKSSRKSGKSGTLIQRNLPEILTLCVLNTLVPNSAMLLVGGHGGGKTSLVKYLGRMMTGKSLDEIEESIVRAHPALTEEKLVATLNIKKLMKDGEEEVIWRKFASNFWKIIDEVNRCSPYTQNILLSLLAEGKIKYYDAVLNVAKYCLFATLNPHDIGTFDLSLPFLDRFGISVPISMPRSQDLAVILESQDEKLGGYDELIQVPKVLTESELLTIWYEVDSIPCNSEAANFIHAIVREFTLCDRIDKGNADQLKPSTGLCSGCHFFIPEKVPCCNTDSILSVRVAKDLLRYARALSWLLGVEKISIPIVQTIAPYVISHRVGYLDRFINKSPYWGNKYLFTHDLVEIIHKRFITRRQTYETIAHLRKGSCREEDLLMIKTMAQTDLIVKHDLLPLALSLSTPVYQKKILEIDEAYQQRQVSTLAQIRRELLLDMIFPNRGELLTQVNQMLRTLTLYNYNCSMQLWDSIRFTIDGLIPQFSPKLKETIQQRGTYRLQVEDLELEVNVTGLKPHDIVNFSFFGGELALHLKEEIDERHRTALKSMEELLRDAKEARELQEKELNIPEFAAIEPKKREPREKSSKDLLNDSFFQT